MRTATEPHLSVVCRSEITHIHDEDIFQFGSPLVTSSKWGAIAVLKNYKYYLELGPYCLSKFKIDNVCNGSPSSLLVEYPIFYLQPITSDYVDRFNVIDANKYSSYLCLLLKDAGHNGYRNVILDFTKVSYLNKLHLSSLARLHRFLLTLESITVTILVKMDPNGYKIWSLIKNYVQEDTFKTNPIPESRLKLAISLEDDAKLYNFGEKDNDSVNNSLGDTNWTSDSYLGLFISKDISLVIIYGSNYQKAENDLSIARTTSIENAQSTYHIVDIMANDLNQSKVKGDLFGKLDNEIEEYFDDNLDFESQEELEKCALLDKCKIYRILCEIIVSHPNIEIAFDSLTLIDVRPNLKVYRNYSKGDYKRLILDKKGYEECISYLNDGVVSNIQRFVYNTPAGSNVNFELIIDDILSSSNLLEIPMQPLADNLPNRSYNVFKRDLTKYNAYRRALTEAFKDIITHRETSFEKDSDSKDETLYMKKRKLIGIEAEEISLQYENNNIIVFLAGAGEGALIPFIKYAYLTAVLILFKQRVFRKNGWNCNLETSYYNKTGVGNALFSEKVLDSDDPKQYLKAIFNEFPLSPKLRIVVIEKNPMAMFNCKEFVKSAELSIYRKSYDKDMESCFIDTGILEYVDSLGDLLLSPISFVETDMREFDGIIDNQEVKAEVIVSELLGSFGCNEASQESLYPLIHKHMEPYGKCIPHSVYSFILPVECESVIHDIEKLQQHPNYLAKIKSQTGMNSGTSSEIDLKQVPFVVNLPHIYKHSLFKPELAFTFHYPTHREVCEFIHIFNESSTSEFALYNDDKNNELNEPREINGLAGMFEARLYKDVWLCNSIPNPKYNNLTARKNAVVYRPSSWFPLFFPFVKPLIIGPNENKFYVNMHRRSVPNIGVWYEWEYDEVDNHDTEKSFNDYNYTHDSWNETTSQRLLDSSNIDKDKRNYFKSSGLHNVNGEHYKISLNAHQ